MARPAKVPRYVEVAEESMREYFDLDLWAMSTRDRTRLLIAACDAETIGTPEEAECYVGVAVYDEWMDMKAERAKKRVRKDSGHA